MVRPRQDHFVKHRVIFQHVLHAQQQFAQMKRLWE
jgi:hypothetical protein